MSAFQMVTGVRGVSDLRQAALLQSAQERRIVRQFLTELLEIVCSLADRRRTPGALLLRDLARPPEGSAVVLPPLRVTLSCNGDVLTCRCSRDDGSSGGSIYVKWKSLKSMLDHEGLLCEVEAAASSHPMISQIEIPQKSRNDRQEGRLNQLPRSGFVQRRLLLARNKRRTKATVIYRRTGNLDAIQLLLQNSDILP
jgi:hypothetical protein